MSGVYTGTPFGNRSVLGRARATVHVYTEIACFLVHRLTSEGEKCVSFRMYLLISHVSFVQARQSLVSASCVKFLIRKNPDVLPNLSRANLSRADLRAKNLSGAILW